jgi:hypothetical protein
MSDNQGHPAVVAHPSYGHSRVHFRRYFAGESEGAGLLRFRTHIKRATLWLGGFLWLLTIPISFYEGLRILRTGLPQAPTVEIVAVTVGIVFAGGVLIAMGSGEGLWKEVLHNFWRYFLLLVLGPALLIAAWYLHTLELAPWRDGLGAAAILLIVSSFFIGSKPPPDDADIEADLDRAFLADVSRHADRLLDELRGGELRLPPALGRDDKVRLLARFPREDELGGRPFMAQPGQDDRPRTTPQGFTLIVFGARSLIVCEGAIDLTSGVLTAYRLREVDHGDIGLLSLEGAGSAYAPPLTRTPRTRARLQMPAMPAPARPTYRTAFAIGLPGGGSVEIVLRDGAMLARTRTFAAVPDNEVAPLTEPDYVRRTWELLAAAKRGSAPQSGQA